MSYGTSNWEFTIQTEDYLDECQETSARVIKYKGEGLSDNEMEYDMAAVNLRLEQMADGSEPIRRIGAKDHFLHIK